MNRTLLFTVLLATAGIAAAHDDNRERGINKAAARWRGGHGSWGEGDSEALRLALRGRDPFADEAALQQFADAAYTVFGAVHDGIAADAPDVHACLPDDDAEDAA